MFDKGTNCGKRATTVAAVHGPEGTIGGAVFGPAGPFAARTTYTVLPLPNAKPNCNQFTRFCYLRRDIEPLPNATLSTICTSRSLKMFSVLLCCIIILWLVYTHYFKPYYTIKRRVRLSGPKPRIYSGNYSEIEKLGVIGSTAKWMSSYGPTYICYYGIRPMIMTQDLEIIKSVMVKNFDCFVNRPYFPALLRRANVQDLSLLRGSQWRRVRRIVTPAFSTKKLKMMAPIIQECCKRLKNKMAAVSDTESSVNVSQWFKMFTMELILATAFSRDVSSEGENPLARVAASLYESGKGTTNRPRLDRLLSILSHFPWSEPILKYFARRTKAAQNWDYLEETALKLIEDRRNTMTTTESRVQDFLQVLLEVYDKSEETKSNRYLDNEEILVSVTSMILVGYETTSSTLSYTAYLLALNPTIQDRLVREINDYYDVNPDSSLYDAAENIEYVTMVLYESLRMYPPVHRTFRECTQTCAVNDELIIEKGFYVGFPNFSLHRNPEYWPNPEKFDPERFNPNNEQSYPTFAYLPFGEGPRNCIGKRLALMNVKMTLITILKDLHFKKTTDTEVPLDLNSSGLTLSPMNGIKLSIASYCN